LKRKKDEKREMGVGDLRNEWTGVTMKKGEESHFTAKGWGEKLEKKAS